MSRRIVTTTYHRTAAAGATLDTYTDKVIKLIPADVVAAWTAITGLIAGAAAGTISNTAYWIIFLVFILLTAAWTYKQTQLAGLPPHVPQILLATLSFIVWVFALGGPFAAAGLGWYNPTLGGIVLIIYTLAAPLFVKDPAPSNPPAPPTPNP